MIRRVAVAALAGMASFSGVGSHADDVTNRNPAATGYPPLTSHQRHFVITDMPNRDALEIAVWAESVREKLSDWAGGPIPLNRVYPLVVGASLREGEAGGRVLKAQRFTGDGFLQQEVTMVNPAAMDQEDVLEALVWLLMNRWIHIRQDQDQRMARPGSFPDWLAVGVAQNMYPALRRRNAIEVTAREAVEGRADIRDVTGKVFMSPGRWPEKALAGLVAGWMTDTMPPRDWLPALAAQAAAGRPLDGAFICSALGFPDERTMDMHWDLWMARQDHRLVPGMLSSDTSAIARILTLPAEDFGVVLPSPDQRITVDWLIEQRREPWVRHYGREVSLRLREEAVGKTPDVVACIAAYLVFFDALAAPTGSSRVKTRNERWLRDAWAEAGQAWNALLARQQEQQALLDRHAGDAIDPVSTMLNRWEP